MIRKWIISIAVFTKFGCVASGALASSVFCSGEVDKIRVDSSGYLIVWGKDGWISGGNRLCQLDGAWEEIGGQTCKSYQGILQQALASSLAVSIEYKNVSFSCGNAPNWAASARPHGIELIKQ